MKKFLVKTDAYKYYGIKKGDVVVKVKGSEDYYVKESLYNPNMSLVEALEKYHGEGACYMLERDLESYVPKNNKPSGILIEPDKEPLSLQEMFKKYIGCNSGLPCLPASPEPKKVKDMTIKAVYSNEPKRTVTVVFRDNTRETVKCCESDNFDVNVGVALAFMQHLCDSKTQFHKLVKEKLHVCESKPKKPDLRDYGSTEKVKAKRKVTK